MPNIAVLTFPGNNCEQETLRALKNSGFEGEIFLWNQAPEDLEKFDGIVIPGGFSFEDRGRSGIISAQEPIFNTVRKMAAQGTPIMGICNGAQMVVESGLILQDAEHGAAGVALLHNERINEEGEILGTGFYHSWVTLKPINKKTPFSNFDHNIYVPIAHGEGRFTVAPELEEKIIEKNLIVFEYVNEEGVADNHYPTNPNGSFKNAAALCNTAGNVVAIMPHPERTQAGQVVFDTFRKYFDAPWQLNAEESTKVAFDERVETVTAPSDIEILVTLKITDKTEKSFETVLQRINPKICVQRHDLWKIHFSEDLSVEEKKIRAQEIIMSHELLNTNKQASLIKINNQNFERTAQGELTNHDGKLSTNAFAVREKEDFLGECKKSHLNHLFPDYGIEEISYGVVWDIKGMEKKELIQMPLFASFVGEEVFAV